MYLLYEVSTSYYKEQIAESAKTMIQLTTYYEIFKIVMNIILPIIIIFGIAIICSRLKQICNILNELLDKTNNIDIRLENLRTKSNENMDALLKLELIKNKNK